MPINWILGHKPQHSVQPPDIFDLFPSSPFNEQVEDEQVENELPNLELGSLTPTLPEDLVTQLE